jgi:hypothetical protein
MFCYATLHKILDIGDVRYHLNRSHNGKFRYSFSNNRLENIPRTEHKGETGIDFWQTLQFEGLRIRFVEYSKAHIVDYWCEKGHVVYCLKGEVINELKDGFLEVC